MPLRLGDAARRSARPDGTGAGKFRRRALTPFPLLYDCALNCGVRWQVRSRSPGLRMVGKRCGELCGSDPALMDRARPDLDSGETGDILRGPRCYRHPQATVFDAAAF